MKTIAKVGKDDYKFIECWSERPHSVFILSIIHLLCAKRLLPNIWSKMSFIVIVLILSICLTSIVTALPGPGPFVNCKSIKLIKYFQYSKYVFQTDQSEIEQGEVADKAETFNKLPEKIDSNFEPSCQFDGNLLCRINIVG